MRRAGQIPGNLVKHGTSASISFDEREFLKLLNAGLRQSSIIQLGMEGNTAETRVLVKEIQRHPVTGKVLHVDLFEVIPGKKVKVKVAIETTGVAKGVKAGGALEHFIRFLSIRAVPESLIDVLPVDITDLDEDQAIHLKDINIPAEWDVILQGNPIVCKVSKGRMSGQAGAEDAKAS